MLPVFFWGTAELAWPAGAARLPGPPTSLSPALMSKDTVAYPMCNLAQAFVLCIHIADGVKHCPAHWIEACVSGDCVEPSGTLRDLTPGI